MALPTPYFGQDINGILDNCSRSYAEYDRTLPVEDLGGFNLRVKGYGTIWAERSDMGRNHGHVVVAGVAGNMSGVPIAILASDEAARKFAKDFETISVPVLMNHDRWIAFVKAAHAAKPLNADVLSQFVSRGRKTAIDASGCEVGASEIAEFYNKGE